VRQNACDGPLHALKISPIRSGGKPSIGNVPDELAVEAQASKKTRRLKGEDQDERTFHKVVNTHSSYHVCFIRDRGDSGQGLLQCLARGSGARHPKRLFPSDPDCFDFAYQYSEPGSLHLYHKCHAAQDGLRRYIRI
jgi:hypothetical protein